MRNTRVWVRAAMTMAIGLAVLSCQSNAAEVKELREQNKLLKQLLEKQTSTAKAEIKTKKESAAVAPKPLPKLGTLEVKVLKMHQSYSYFKIALRVTNRSDQFLTYVGLKVLLKDQAGNFLGTAKHAGQQLNVQPGQTWTKETGAADVNARRVGSYEIEKETIRVRTADGKEHNWTHRFDVVELKY